jgi:hypothetical protein
MSKFLVLFRYHLKGVWSRGARNAPLFLWAVSKSVSPTGLAFDLKGMNPT